MLKYTATILILLSLLTSAAFPQALKKQDRTAKKMEKIQVGQEQKSSFYQDYQLRKKSMMPKSAAEAQDLVFASYDWIYNDYVPNKLVMHDIDNDGTKDPIAIGEHGDPTRFARIAYIDNFGADFYPLYGINSETGSEYRTGYNSHLILDSVNNALYASVYDALSGALLNYVWAIDLATDITAPTKVTGDTYAGSWPRMCLLANGDFLSIDDNTYDGNFRIMRSTDGGVSFDSVNAIGADDPNFWFVSVASDPLIETNGEKVSIITGIEKVDDHVDIYDVFGEEGGVADEDSVNCMYHYYSLDGGATWTGEIIELDGKKDQIVNRAGGNWARVASWDKGDFVVGSDGVTHHVNMGVNSLGVNGNGDTLYVYPEFYWNDRDKQWLALSDTATENNDPLPDGVAFDRPANMLGNSLGTIAVSRDGNVVAAVWVIPEYSGEWGHSDINFYPGDGGENTSAIYYTDLVYAFSYDGGKTWSAAAALEEKKNYPEQWPVLSPVVEVNGDQATINYMYYMDPVPGSSLVGPDNGVSLDAKWVYNSKTFPIGSVGVNDDKAVVKNYSLEQNYPNPFNPSTEIKFTLAKSGNVSLKIYDVLGREVATLVNGAMESGSHTLNFNASNLSSGMYLYTINADNFSMTKKMMLMK